MGPELLEIVPQELKFTFELKKQSMCSVQLVNNSDQFVAFKVKTTSPKKYCVRPNVGIVQPRSASDFTVTMQAQKVAPIDMQCRDKFLIQSTIVPFGTSEDDISPSLFAKDNGKYIEEIKLRVVLLSPPDSPVLQPVNGGFKQEPGYEAPVLRDQVLNSVENLLLSHKVVDDMEELKPTKDIPVLKPATGVQEKVADMDLKLSEDVRKLGHAKDVGELRLYEDEKLKVSKDEDLGGVKNVEKLRVDHDIGEVEPAKDKEELRLHKDVKELRLPKAVEEFMLAEDLEELKPAKVVHELSLAEDMEKFRLATAVEVLKPFNSKAMKQEQDVEELRVAKDAGLRLAKDIEKLKLKLKELELKQSEAEVTITRLEEERGTSLKERQTLKEELATLKRKTVVRTLPAGFPYLFVGMVALVSVVVGYMLQSVHASFPLQFAITVAIVSVVLGYILGS